MGIANLAIGTVFGGDPLDLSGEAAAGATREAANIQLRSTREGIAEQKRARVQAREDLQPFRQAGEQSLSGLSDLVTSPEAQTDFIQDNEFLDFITGEAATRLGQNPLTSGGSDQSARARENSLMLLAPDLINQSFSQRFNLAGLGANAAAQQATQTLGVGANIADLFTQGANAQAAGTVGAQNAQTNAQNQAAAGLSSYYANR